MGLDNIPKIYPCQKAKTAVMAKREDGLEYVDCESTMECGGCVYKYQVENDPIVKNSTPVYGLFGVPCWYRGKYGNSLLYTAKDFGFDYPFDFYGPKRDGLDLDESLTLSKWMADHTESFAYIVKTENLDPRILDDWIYASWWLKFCANYSEGVDVWY